MTREEQIRQASIEYTIKNRPMCIGGGAFSEVADEMNRNYAFEEGAKWADKEHGKELMYAIQKTHERTKIEVINKACEYLRAHLWQNVDDDNDPIVESVHNITLNDFIKDFKRAMEE